MKKNTASADLDPQAVKIGKWEFPPLTINTAILLERIDSPFMRPPEIVPGSGKVKIGKNGKPELDQFGKEIVEFEYVKTIPKIEDLAKTLYVLIHAEDPPPILDAILNDETKFRNSVSELARQISFREMATITKSLNDLMSAADKAVSEAGLEGDGRKNDHGRFS